MITCEQLPDISRISTTGRDELVHENATPDGTRLQAPIGLASGRPIPRPGRDELIVSLATTMKNEERRRELELQAYRPI